MADKSHKPRRRWPRIVMWTVIVLVAVIAPALGWIFYKAGQQRVAMAELKKFGAICLPNDGDSLTALGHLRKWLGDEEPMDIKTVMAFHRMTDDGLVYLRVLPKVEELQLVSTRVTDGGLGHLANLTQLRALDLDGTAVTDAGLSHLRGLTNLGFLNFNGTHITAAGIRELRKSIPNLTTFPEVDWSITAKPSIAPREEEEDTRPMPRAYKLDVPVLVVDPPVVIGTETSAEGKLVRRIVFEGSYHKIGWEPDWDGGHDVRDYHGHFFLERPGKPRLELPFLSAVIPRQIIMRDICEPVGDGAMWVLAGFFAANKTNTPPLIEFSDHISVVVFDDTQVLHKHRFAVARAEYPAKTYWFDDGNRVLHFLTIGGQGTYDLMTDTTEYKRTVPDSSPELNGSSP